MQVVHEYMQIAPLTFRSYVVVNSIADFNNRSLMGVAQEKCNWSEAVQLADDNPTGLYDTLSESKARNAIWRSR